jgi:hypothetical protein
MPPPLRSFFFVRRQDMTAQIAMAANGELLLVTNRIARVTNKELITYQQDILSCQEDPARRCKKIASVRSPFDARTRSDFSLRHHGSLRDGSPPWPMLSTGHE